MDCGRVGKVGGITYIVWSDNHGTLIGLASHIVLKSRKVEDPKVIWIEAANITNVHLSEVYHL